MRIPVFFLLFFLLTAGAKAQPASAPASRAPASSVGASLGVSLGSVGLRVDLDADGRLRYAVTYGQRPVVQPSRLGLRLAEGPGSDGGPGFDGPLRLLGHDTATVDSTWQPVWGEEASIRTHYRQLTLHLCPLAAPARRLDLVFRVFADGVGFRYELPAQPALRFLVVAAELTEFALPVDPTAFWLPGDEDSNEYPYAITPLSQVDNAALVRASTDIAVRAAPDPQAVQTPLLLHYPTGPYVALHEAAQVNYPALQLHVDGPAHRLTARLVPDAGGAAAYLRTPARTPWRTVLIGARAADLLTSRLILNLNEPSTIADPSWIHPMKFVGVWWEMQTGRGTWSYANRADTLDAQGRLLPHGRHSATTANVQRYIDFAAQHHIPGVLVEGWNTGWEDWFGHWQEDVFDFVTPYPDFDVAGLQRYAQARGVQLIMHHETAGAATGYEQRLDSAYRFMTRFGYPAVKTGYVGRIVPRGEHHDGQWMSNHYVRVAQAAARHRLLVDMHEPTRPSGLQRTYPNWLASEAGRGNEYNAFTAAGNAPNHETILPFTRLLGGPMDYTPGLFQLRHYAPGHPERQVHTTLCKQLALYVVLYSPLQMAADLPDNYNRHLDAFQFIEDVPVDWAQTRVLEAEPGQYVSIARQQKGGADWFVGAITNEQARTAVLDLGFLPAGRRYRATLYLDGAGADWRTRPEAYRITTRTVRAGTRLRLPLAPGGGAALRLTPLD